MKDHLIKLRSHKQALEFNQKPWNDQGLIHLGSLKMPTNQLRSTEIPKGLFSRFQHLDAQLTKQDSSSKTDEALGSGNMNPVREYMNSFCHLKNVVHVIPLGVATYVWTSAIK